MKLGIVLMVLLIVAFGIDGIWFILSTGSRAVARSVTRVTAKEAKL